MTKRKAATKKSAATAATKSAAPSSARTESRSPSLIKSRVDTEAKPGELRNTVIKSTVDFGGATAAGSSTTRQARPSAAKRSAMPATSTTSRASES